MKMEENTILIAGGTSGIGLGLALRFHDAGNQVIIAGRRQEQLEEITAAHDGMDAVVLDVTDPSSIASVYERVTSAHPGLNVLINMAGIMAPENLLDRDSLAVSENTIDTNLLGPIRMINAFLPFLIRQDDAVIVNVTSGLAYVPLPITPTYSATKAAIHSYTESLRVQLADTSVQVIELAPPLTRTALMGSENNELAMPLDDFLTETMTLFETQPDAEQILVERVKQQRFAADNGNYAEVLARQSGR